MLFQILYLQRCFLVQSVWDGHQHSSSFLNGLWWVKWLMQVQERSSLQRKRALFNTFVMSTVQHKRMFGYKSDFQTVITSSNMLKLIRAFTHRAKMSPKLLDTRINTHLTVHKVYMRLIPSLSSRCSIIRNPRAETRKGWWGKEGGGGGGGEEEDGWASMSWDWYSHSEAELNMIPH